MLVFFVLYVSSCEVAVTLCPWSHLGETEKWAGVCRAVTDCLNVVGAATKNGHESSRNKDIIENENDGQHLLGTLHDELEIRDYLSGSSLKRVRDPETIIWVWSTLNQLKRYLGLHILRIAFLQQVTSPFITATRLSWNDFKEVDFCWAHQCQTGRHYLFTHLGIICWDRYSEGSWKILLTTRLVAVKGAFHRCHFVLYP